MVVTVSRRPYRTDLSDARWALIEPMLSAWRSQRAGLGIAKIQHNLREIVNAVLYVNRTGIAWEYLPHDFPRVQDGVRLLRPVGEGRGNRGHPRGVARSGRPGRPTIRRAQRVHCRLPGGQDVKQRTGVITGKLTL